MTVGLERRGGTVVPSPTREVRSGCGRCARETHQNVRREQRIRAAASRRPRSESFLAAGLLHQRRSSDACDARRPPSRWRVRASRVELAPAPEDDRAKRRALRQRETAARQLRRAVRSSSSLARVVQISELAIPSGGRVANRHMFMREELSHGRTEGARKVEMAAAQPRLRPDARLVKRASMKSAKNRRGICSSIPGPGLVEGRRGRSSSIRPAPNPRRRTRPPTPHFTHPPPWS